MMRFFSEYLHALVYIEKKVSNILKDKFLTFNTMSEPQKI